MEDIRGLKPLVDLVPEALGLLLLLLALLSVGLGIAWALRQKMPQPKVMKRPLSIRQRLDILRSKRPPSGVFCATLSEIMRDFLKVRYGLLCRKLTTSEIIEEMNRRGLPHLVTENLGGILAACDLVKFAKWSPDPIELEQQLTSAYLLLEEA